MRKGELEKQEKKKRHAFEVQCPLNVSHSVFRRHSRKRALLRGGTRRHREAFDAVGPYQLARFQKPLYRGLRSLRHAFHLPPPTPQRPAGRVEKVICKALPLAVPRIVPDNVVVTLVFPWLRDEILADPSHYQVSHSAAPRLTR